MFDAADPNQMVSKGTIVTRSMELWAVYLPITTEMCIRDRYGTQATTEGGRPLWKRDNRIAGGPEWRWRLPCAVSWRSVAVSLRRCV